MSPARREREPHEPGPEPELLTTKLFPPASRPNLVSRARITACLDAGLKAGKRLTLVSAPPGYGKSTLVAS